MKRYTPYALPLAVLVVVFLLVFRWYNNQQATLPPADRLISEGVMIEDLTEDQAQSALTGVGDYNNVELTSTGEGSGTIRYQVEDDKVMFGVVADLPELPSGSYYVWLREVNGTALRQAFVLEPGKGGFIGTGALPADLLPLEVIVSSQEDEVKVDERAVLRGTIMPPEAE